MDINRIGASKIVNIYGASKKGDISQVKQKTARDSLEISSLGKSLSAYETDDIEFTNLDKRVETIKNNIVSQNYSVDCGALAKKIVGIMKEKGV